MHSTAHIEPQKFATAFSSAELQSKKKMGLIDHSLRYTNASKPYGCLTDNKFGPLNESDRVYSTMFEDLNLSDILTDTKNLLLSLEQPNYKNELNNFFTCQTPIIPVDRMPLSYGNLIDTSNETPNQLTNVPQTLFSPEPISPIDNYSKMRFESGDLRLFQQYDKKDEMDYYNESHSLIQRDLLNDMNDVSSYLPNEDRCNLRMLLDERNKLKVDIISMQKLLGEAYSPLKPSTSVTLTTAATPELSSLDTSCKSNTEERLVSPLQNSEILNSSDAVQPCNNFACNKAHFNQAEARGEKTYGTPMVIVHPEEFRNPSSFLKVYGDPLCGRVSTMTSGQNGNWSCVFCGNINYPRRFRCNKCNETRDKKGDEIVNSYVQLVYEQHIRAYRKMARNNADHKQKFVTPNGLSNVRYWHNNTGHGNNGVHNTNGNHSSGGHGSGGHSGGSHNNGSHTSGGHGSGNHTNGNHNNGSHNNGNHNNGNHNNGNHNNGNHNNGNHNNGNHNKNGVHSNGNHGNVTHNNGSNTNGGHNNGGHNNGSYTTNGHNNGINQDHPNGGPNNVEISKGRN